MKIRHLIISCVLIAISASISSAQESLTPQKRVAINKLIEATGVQRHSAAMFEEMVSRYQKNWPGAVIADFKAKGLFKSLTTEEAAQMEKLIHEFSDSVFNEVKRRVVQEVLVGEVFENLGMQPLDKFFTTEEINELAALCQTPTVKKFLASNSRVWTEAVISSFQAKGVFNVSPSVEAEEAKANRLYNELEENPTAELQRIIAIAETIRPDHFTETEIQELRAFSETALGKKLTEVYPRIVAEAMAGSMSMYGTRVAELTGEVYAEQMEMFQARTHEILKKHGPRRGTKKRARR